MNRQIASLALLFCVGCVYSGDTSLGPCKVATDCSRLDGGELLGATCNDGRCAYTCSHVCDPAETCDGANCVLVGPKITSVNAPTTWVLQSGTVTVTAVVDDTTSPTTNGPGIKSATLRAGGNNYSGSTSDTGFVRTYTFMIPGSLQPADTETPIDFTITATDEKGGVTPNGAAGRGQLLIDAKGPTVNGVTVNGGVAVGPAGQQIKWFPQSQSTAIDVQVSIQDAASGVLQSSLALMAGAARIDSSTPSLPSPSCTAVTAQTLTCHFLVVPSTLPSTVVPSGGQRRVQFAVAGTDVIGNPVTTNTAALGVDGKPPTITFTVGAGGTTTYPVANADCNGGVADANLYCGHDNNRFWRSGDSKYTFKFTVSDAYASPDDQGSGADPAGGKCTINGVTTCTVTYDSTSGSFTFPADFSGGTFASGTDGIGNLNVAVDAKDAVGNPAAQVVAGVAVTRVKWVRRVAITATAGAPLLSGQLGQVIVGGTVVSGDPIVALKTADGAIAWSTGGSLSPAITSITANMALDTTASTDPAHPTPVLYANSGDNFYALHISTNSVDKYCTSSITGLTGSPMIFGAGASALAVVAGSFTVHAFALKPTGGGCTEDIPFGAVGNSSTHPTFGPPSANGSGIYFGYDNSANVTNDLGIRSFQFDGSTFSAPNSRNLGRQPTTNVGPAAIAPAADLFFGVNGDHTFYRHSAADLSLLTWAPTPLGSSQNIFSQPLVSGNFMFAMSNTLTAFRLSDAGSEWVYSTGVTQVSPPTIAKTTFFVSEQLNRQMVALKASDRSQLWAYTGSGTTSPSTRISSVATEATLGSDGVLYFGDSGGRLYALFVDDTLLATAPGDWPRTGYDNCNSNHSNNAGFVCQ